MERKRLFWNLFLINFAIALGFGIVDTFFSVYVISLGAQGALFAFSVTVYSVAKASCSIFAGRQMDRLGARNTLLLSMGIYSAVSCGYLFADSLISIILLRFFQGVACALFRPVLLSLVQRTVTHNRPATILGTFDISFYCAVALGPITGGLIKDSWGFHGLFAALFIICIAATTLALLMLSAQSPEGKSVSRIQNQQPGGTDIRFPGQGLAGLLIFIFGRACGISVLMVFLPVFLADRLELDSTRVGLAMACSTVMLLALLRPAGKLADRTSPRLMVLLGGSCSGIALMVVPWAESFGIIILLTAMMGICTSLSQPAGTTLLLAEGRRNGSGRAYGLFYAALNLGFICGPLAGTVLFRFSGIDAVFYGAGATGIVSALAMLRLRPLPETSEEPALLAQN